MSPDGQDSRISIIIQNLLHHKSHSRPAPPRLSLCSSIQCLCQYFMQIPALSCLLQKVDINGAFLCCLLVICGSVEFSPLLNLGSWLCFFCFSSYCFLLASCWQLFPFPRFTLGYPQKVFRAEFSCHIHPWKSGGPPCAASGVNGSIKQVLHSALCCSDISCQRSLS